MWDPLILIQTKVTPHYRLVKVKFSDYASPSACRLTLPRTAEHGGLGGISSSCSFVEEGRGLQCLVQPSKLVLELAQR